MAFWTTVGFHAIVIGALAAITVHLIPSNLDRGEIEASFDPARRVPADPAVIEAIAQRRPQFLDAATELQTRELPYVPAELTVPEPTVPALNLDAVPELFDAEFLPPKKKPQAVAKQVRSRPTTNRIPQKTSNSNRRPSKPKFTKARVRSTPSASYPDSARRRGQEGTVQVRLSVSASGKVTAASISKSSGISALDASALRAAKRWRFHPATSGGTPVSSSVVVPFRFNLD